MPGLYPANQKLSRATPVKLASGHQELSRFLSNRPVDGGLGASPVIVAEGARAQLNPVQCWTAQHPPSSPAHPSSRLLAHLNENWRVVDDPLQWILQRRKGNPRTYAAAKRGELPVIRIGKRILVLREPFKRMLGDAA